MQQEEKQTLIERKSVSTIRNERLRREFEMLRPYNHEIKQEQERTSIILHNVLEIGSLTHSLTLFIPPQYPFKEPSYAIDSGTPSPISQLIEDWSPRYKIIQMIGLVVRRSQQTYQLQSALTYNPVYQLFRHFSNYIWVLAFALLVRLLLSMAHSHEISAQKKCMIITINRSFEQWYYIGQGLEHPPVMGYLCYFLATMYMEIQPQALLLQDGYESVSGGINLFSRLVVIVSDALFLMPALLLLMEQLSPVAKRPTHLLSALLLVLLIQSDLLFDGMGLECIPVGLLLYSTYCVLIGRLYLSSILFTLAINTTQISLYYAFGLISAVLATILFRFRGRTHQILTKLMGYCAIMVVISVIIWLPWLGSLNTFTSVWTAITGKQQTYEYIASNFWGVTGLLCGWESFFTHFTLTTFSYITSFVLSLPCMLAMVMKPTHRILLMGLASTSITFFMFSYQAGSASILLPLTITSFLSPYLSGYFVVQVVVVNIASLMYSHYSIQYLVFVLLYVVIGVYYYKAERTFLSIVKGGTNQDSIGIERVHRKLHEKPIMLMFAIMAIITISVLKLVGIWEEKFAQELFVLLVFFFNSYYWAVLNSCILNTIHSNLISHQHHY